MELGVMNDLPTFLGSVTEFSIGLAGFTGVVFVLGSEMQSDRRIAILRFLNLLVSSFAAGFFAMLPMALTNFSINYSEAVSTAMICFAIFMGVWISIAAFYVPRQGTVTWLSSTSIK